MFDQYAMAITDNINQELEKVSFAVDILTDIYTEFGVDEEMYNYIRDRNSTNPFLFIDFDYKYITDYNTRKYCTQNSAGKKCFWEYDYKRNFPVHCRPRLVVFGDSEAIVSEVVDKINDIYSIEKSIEIKHPILPNNNIDLKLCIKNKNDIIQTNNGLYTTWLCFDEVIIPWFWNRFDNKYDYNHQINIINVILALTMIIDSCSTYLNSHLSSVEDIEHTREKLYSIRSTRKELFELVNIPHKMQNLNEIIEIRDCVQENRITIFEAIQRKIRFEKKIQEENRIKAVEALRKKELQEKKQKEDAMRRRIMQEHQQQYEYYEESDYYDNYPKQGGPGFLSSLIHQSIEERNIKHNVGKRGKRDLIGQSGCAKTYGESCSNCSFRMACSRYW